MIQDLSRALKSLLEGAQLLPLGKANFSFKRPTENEFTPTAPATVNLFLYDIRENTELRNNEPLVDRDHGVARVRRPPLRVDCSYLLTAWPTEKIEANRSKLEVELLEQLLLSQSLQVLSQHATIPDEYLKGGALASQEPPLPMLTAQTNGLKEPAEFWNAIGNKLRASLSITATISMDVFEATDVPVVIAPEIGLKPDVARPEEHPFETDEVFFHIAGRVIEHRKDESSQTIHAPAVDAIVRLDELELRARTDAQGQYRLGPIESDPTDDNSDTPKTYEVFVTYEGKDYPNQTITIVRKREEDKPVSEDHYDLRIDTSSQPNSPS